MGALVLIPAYPYGVVFFFGTLGLFQTLMYARETRDIYYTALLPVGRREVVKGKLLLAAFAQLSQLLISVPFALLRTLYLPGGNPAGIEANVAYYGFGLMIFGAFNLVFFSSYFRTADRVGKAFLAGLVPVVLGIGAMETAVHVPGLAWLDGLAPELLLRQLPVLLAGAVVYGATWYLAYTVSVRRFERVDL